MRWIRGAIPKMQPKYMNQILVEPRHKALFPAFSWRC